MRDDLVIREVSDVLSAMADTFSDLQVVAFNRGDAVYIRQEDMIDIVQGLRLVVDRLDAL